MKILHTEQGFTAQDKLKFRSVIYSNIVRNMKILSDAIDKLNIPLSAPEVRQRIMLIEVDRTFLSKIKMRDK